ncbi:hypothetical protein WDU94_013994 [Cyamophila willieti]
MTKSVKLLGVHIDEQLKWSCHIEYLAKKLKVVVFQLRRLSNLVDKKTLLLYYHSNFASLLSYGVVFWANSSEAERIFLLQKQTVRILTRKPRIHSCRELFCEINILTLYGTYVLNCLLLVKESPEILANTIAHSYNTRLRKKNEIQIPRNRLKVTQKNSDYEPIKMYNHLPESIKTLDVAPFKEIIKRVLIKKVLYRTEDFFELEVNDFS